MRKIKPYSRTYNKREITVMSGFSPPIRPCNKCGSPVADGYLCQFCGNDNSVDDTEEDNE